MREFFIVTLIADMLVFLPPRKSTMPSGSQMLASSTKTYSSLMVRFQPNYVHKTGFGAQVVGVAVQDFVYRY
jgi:hypothetical protein